jgi:putative transposase
MRRKIYDDEKHAQFVTFSCYKRRTLLNPNQSKRIVIGTLGSRLAGQDGICIGFVVMPDHVHALIWFPEVGQLSAFMNKWKELTSKSIKKLYREKFPNFWKKLHNEDPVWQPKYHSFNVFSEKKIEEKLDYMHLNPVRAGLAKRAVDWTWSSARWYLQGKQVGVPISMPGGII